MSVPLEEVIEQMEENGGYCLHCQDWTHDCCEPDACNYKCPVCEKNQVFGAEELLIMGIVE